MLPWIFLASGFALFGKLSSARHFYNCEKFYNKFPGGVVTESINNVTDAADTWVLSKSAPTGAWNGIASDSSGKNLIAAARNVGSQMTGIYLSTDAAKTWTNIFINGCGAYDEWKGVASSTDGTYLFAIQESIGLFYSVTSGKGWFRTIVDSALGSYTTFSSVACSGNGGTVAVTVQNGAVYVSQNSGYSFFKTTAPTANFWKFVAVSNDGRYMTAGTGSDYLWSSADFGHTWNQNSAPQQNWYSVSYSSGGQYAVAVADGGPYSSYYGGGVYVSSDAGVTWQLGGADRSQKWKTASIDATGSHTPACSFLSLSFCIILLMD